MYYFRLSLKCFIDIPTRTNCDPPYTINFNSSYELLSPDFDRNYFGNMRRCRRIYESPANTRVRYKSVCLCVCPIMHMDRNLISSSQTKRKTYILFVSSFHLSDFGNSELHGMGIEYRLFL